MASNIWRPSWIVYVVGDRQRVFYQKNLFGFFSTRVSRYCRLYSTLQLKKWVLCCLVLVLHVVSCGAGSRWFLRGSILQTRSEWKNNRHHSKREKLREAWIFWCHWFCVGWIRFVLQCNIDQTSVVIAFCSVVLRAAYNTSWKRENSS